MARLRPEEWLARLTDPSPRTRKRAVPRVCELAAKDGSLLAILREALRSPNTRAVFWMVSDIGSLGPRGRVAVPELVRVLESHEAFGVRQAAVAALASVAPDDPQAKAAIFRAFADRSPHVRREALQAVISVHDLSEEDLGRIKEMEADADTDVARWSEIALRNIRLGRARASEPSAPADRGR